MHVEQILFFSLIVIFLTHLFINNQMKNLDSDKVKNNDELGAFSKTTNFL